MTDDLPTPSAGSLLRIGSPRVKVYTADQMREFAQMAALAEREACAEKTGEFARKWWSIHCDSNKHMETTLKAHQDFCALQAAIKSRDKHDTRS
jgi:hypothetical protein